MTDSLIIVDSPAKGQVYNEFFSDKAEVIVSMAPVVKPSHRSPAGEIQSQAVMSFEPLPDGAEILDRLQAFNGENIYLALDGDRRSEYLGWLINSFLMQASNGRKMFKRLMPAGVRSEEIQEALHFATTIEDQQGFGFYTGFVFDSCLAKHLTRLIGTNRGPGNFPLQFNSLTTLFLLADRQTEITMYSPSKKWQLLADFDLDGNSVQARLEGAFDITVDGFVKEVGQARKIIELIQNEKFVVDRVSHSSMDISAPAPYMLVELLQDAMAKGIGPKDLLGIVRKLFHGVEINGKVKGVISSFYSLENANSSEWLLAIREHVIAVYGEDHLGNSFREPVDGMIFPLDPTLKGEDLTGALTAEEITIYELIRCRAIASQMKQAVGENVIIEICAGSETLFTTHYTSLLNRGFLAVYPGSHEKLLTPSPLAKIVEGQEMQLVRVVPQETSGVPAEHYTIETLFADLADFAIVPDPVNIFMLQGLINAEYINISPEGYLMAGQNVSQVATIMDRAFPRMRGIQLSAYFKQTIDEVISGRKGLDFAIKQFDQTMMIHGKTLVKAKIPSKLRPRSKSSTSIIKQVNETEPVPKEPKETVPAAPSPAKQEPSPAHAEVPGAELDKVDQQQISSVSEEIGNDETPVSPQQEMEPAVVDEAKAIEAEAQPVDQGEEQGSSQEEAEPSEIPESEGSALGIAGQDVSEPDSVEPLEEAAFLAEGDDEWPDELNQEFAKAESEAETDLTAEGAVTEDESQTLIQTDQQRKCQVCGKPMLLKEDRFGKFWSCSGFPGCRHTETYSDQAVMEMACPVCSDGKIVNKRTPAGKTFYVCVEQECEFMSWAKPHYIACQLCGSPYLVEKKDLRGKVKLRCPRAGCDYGQSLGVGTDGIQGKSAPSPKKKNIKVRRVAKGSTAARSGGGKKKVRVVRRKKR